MTVLLNSAVEWGREVVHFLIFLFTSFTCLVVTAVIVYAMLQSRETTAGRLKVYALVLVLVVLTFAWSGFGGLRQ